MDKARILIVEDEAIIAADLADRLRRMGHEVVGSSATAEESVRMATALMPDLVMMDVKLRGPGTGIDAARQMTGPDAPAVIYLTAYADDAILAAAKTTEPYGFLVKPYDERALRACVEVSLHRRWMERERARLQRELDAAEGRIRVLNRILSVCAGCKKIRDREGHWRELEWYVEKFTETEVSHGLCEECGKKYGGEFYKPPAERRG